MKKRLDNKVFKNFSYLFGVEFFTLLIPFLLYPYLIHVLGVSTYGRVVFIQLIISYFVVAMQFGFNLTATRDISVNRDDDSVINVIFSSVFIIKIFILLLCGLITLFIYNTLNYDEKGYLLFASILIIADIFNLQWFYQGVERLRGYSIAMLISKVAILLLSFVLVQDDVDTEIYLAIVSFTTLITQVALFVYSINSFNIKFIVDSKYIASTFKENLSFFFSRASVMIAEKSGLTFLGVNDPTGIIIAQYDLASKLVGLFQVPFTLFNRAYYPHASKEKNAMKVIKLLSYLFFISLIMYIISISLSEWFIDVYTGNKNLAYASSIFAILAVTVPINVVSHNVGNCILIVNRFNAWFNYSVISGSALYIILASLGFYLNIIDAKYLAIISVIFPVYVALIRVIGVIKNRTILRMSELNI